MDDSVFSFQMTDVTTHRPLEIEFNEMYGSLSNQGTLSDVYQQHASCNTSENEDCSVQVVPEDDSRLDKKSTTHFVKRRRNAMKAEGNPNSLTIENTSCPSRGYPGSPRRMPLFNASTEALHTPTFPALKSPSIYSARSPLATMLLSPFGRKPSEDLSAYLPDHFTPMPTLDLLECSISSPVFKFPSLEGIQERKKLDCEVDEIDLPVGSTSERDTEYQEVFFDLNDNFLITEKQCWKEDKDVITQNTSNNLTKAKGKKNELRKTVTEKALDVRNKLERKRRNEMNAKYDKLKRHVPELEKKAKVSKIAILKAALEYIKELEKQSELLTKQHEQEKRRNDELLKLLIKINT